MLASAQEKDQIRIECFAKKGSNCINAVMTKVLFCNESCTHHHPTCISGDNFGDCYDRVAHPPANIALQSFGVPCPAIRVLLLAMQTMRFFLQMGYGESDRSYGGLTEDRTLGLGQGNAAAGPGFLAISAQIVNTYLRDGHGARTMTSLSHNCFILTAVLYVDNADNIHMTALMSATTKALIDHAQLSTNAWGGLAIATNAAMKPDKCFAYFLIYNFSNGRPLMGSIGSLLAPASSIPQLEGPLLPSHMTVPLPWNFCLDTHITTHNGIVNAWNMARTCITRHQTHCQDVPEKHELGRPSILQATPTLQSMGQLFIAIVPGYVMGNFHRRTFSL